MDLKFNTEAYWQRIIGIVQRSAHSEYVAVDHVLYFIQGEELHPVMRGFGGREFLIEYVDGTQITTTNLWLVGDIPEQHWAALPDNAKFLKTERDKRIDEFIEDMMSRPTKERYERDSR